jgi:tetratricopeptide (TPR) repeat protein
MLRALRIQFLLLALLGLSACALPREKKLPIVGIATPEIKAVNLTREGLALYEKSRFDEAEMKFRQALYLRSYSPSIKLSLAAALRSQQLYDQALAVLNSITGLEAQKVEVRLGLAATLFEAGRYEEAYTLWSDLADQFATELEFSQLAVVLQNMAAGSFSEGYETEALCSYFEKSQVAADSATLSQFLRMYSAAGFYRKAYDMQLELLEAQPDVSDAEFWQILALNAVALNEQDVAIKAFARMAAHLSTRPDLSLKFDILKEALLHFYPDVEVRIQEVLLLKPGSRPATREELQDAPLIKPLDVKVYKNILSSEEGLYYPPRMLEFFEAKIAQSHQSAE